MNWFYSPDGSQRHEVSEEVLAGLARDGRLTGDMLLWREGQPDWLPAREIRPELFPVGGSPSDLPPRPSVPPPPPPPADPSATARLGGSGGLNPRMGDPYAPPTYGSGSPRQQTNSAALTSLISGILGVVGATTGFCCCFGFLLAPVAGLVAVIFGHQAYAKAQGYPEADTDKTMALVGLILGYLCLALTVGGILFNLIFVGFAGMGAAMEGMKTGNFNF
ncbi:MAG: GYF domain-containing protein [Verrucomicrobiales bacterium]